MVASPASEPLDPRSITRPDPVLLKYYFLVAALTLPAFPVVFLPLYFKYHTLKYRFDSKGISMSWGILFRREIYLTYRRIQDIHVTRNILQRWLDLASVALQTASGSAGAEMSIEGIRQPETLRDYLYAQMRGAREGKEEGQDSEIPVAAGDEALTLLREIRDELRALRSEREGAS